MLIKFDKSILENIDKFTENDIECIDRIALSMKENKHVVFLEYEDVKKILGLKSLNRNSTKVFNNILKKWFIIKGIEKKVLGKVLVTYNDDNIRRINEGEKTIYRVPLKYFDDTEKLLPLHIVGEDESDCTFYTDIAKRYIRDNRVGIAINTRVVHGGGGKTGVNYERELTSCNKVCLSIADSDRKTKQSDIGDTAKSIRAVYNRNKNKYVTDIYILKVREKENLIPIDLYMLCTRSCDYEIDMKILKYIANNENLSDIYYYGDIKDGITYKSIIFNDINKLLKQHIKEIANSSNFEEILKKIESYGLKELYNYIIKLEKAYDNNTLNEVCCTTMQESSNNNEEFFERKLTKGISGMLEVVRKEIICSGLQDIIKTKKEIYTNTKSDHLKDAILEMEDTMKKINNLYALLPDNIREEWETISNKIITWGCCWNDFIA